MLRYAMPCRVIMLRYGVVGRAALCDVLLCYAMLYYVMLCCTVLSHVVLCYGMLRYVTLGYAMLRYVAQCCAMLCYATFCYAMLYDVVVCYAMLCYVMIVDCLVFIYPVFCFVCVFCLCVSDRQFFSSRLSKNFQAFCSGCYPRRLFCYICW